MTPGDTRRITRFCLGTLVGGFALAGLAAPMATAAPDCSPANVDSTVNSVTQQAQAYMDAHPAGNKMLLTAALQPRQQASATIAAYATSNPQEYAEFKAILAPLGTLQSQCGVQVVPAQFQWAFDQFIGG
jgi:hemophore-related protein